MTDKYYDAEGFCVSCGNTAEHCETPVITVSAVSGVELEYEIPKAEYMYGCAATVVGMLLGYYDRWGYLGYDASNLIDGVVELNARGTDGNKYDMDAFDTVLGSAIASREYVDRFYDADAVDEFYYTYTDTTPTLNTSAWNCIADYLGTGQYWRGNSDLSTAYYPNSVLEDILQWTYTNLSRSKGGIEVEVPAKFRSMLYGLNLYVNNAGYRLDTANSRGALIDTNGGDFTFEDFCDEIDAGRAVIIHIESHAMLAYGYDKSTGEIIFDDTYEHDCRMEWGGSYEYADENRKMLGVTLVAFDTSSMNALPDRLVAPSVSVSEDNWTSSSVTVTARFAQNSVLNEYSYDNVNWNTYTRGITVSSNQTLYFRSKDIYDKYSNVTAYEVDNIDTNAPTVLITGNLLTLTNSDVILTVNASDDLSGILRIEYSYDRNNWITASTVTVSENRDVYFRIYDRAGNVTAKTVNVSNIDKTPPAVPEVFADTETWTNKNVIVSVYFSHDSAKKEYSYDGTNWGAYTKPLVITENCSVFFRSFDAAGNSSLIVEYRIANIDREPPVLTVLGNALEPTNEDIVLVPETNEGVAEFYDNGKWVAVSSVTIRTNGIYKFRALDPAGNLTEQEVVVDKIDKIAPDKPTVSADILEFTNQIVTVSAVFADDSVQNQYSFDGETWQDYTAGVKTDENRELFFRSIDAAGNISENAVYEVVNIDTATPDIPDGLTVSFDDGTLISWDEAADTGIAGLKGYFIRWGTSAELSGDGEFVSSNSIRLRELALTEYYYQVRSVDNVGNFSAWSEKGSFEVILTDLDNLHASSEGISWDNVPGVNGYTAEYSTDNFASKLTFELETNGIDTFLMPSGNYQWQVTVDKYDLVVSGEDIAAANVNRNPGRAVSDADGDKDVFFAVGYETWSRFYSARHTGIAGVWDGTGAEVNLNGKNRISDVFEGSADANVLVLTDAANGDAFFLEDIYSAFGDGMRFSQIDEIRAGAGDDIIDMTSQLFKYSDSNIRVHGGSGDDVIWGNSGSNIIFGDSGNDSIVGGVGDDIIIGGSGDDVMHGGGGNDIFTFGADFGTDKVEQLYGGSVTLCFENGSADNWNAAEMVYKDGDNSVQVTGVGIDDVILKFGNDISGLPDGAFADSSSEKIFEKNAVF